MKLPFPWKVLLIHRIQGIGRLKHQKDTYVSMCMRRAFEEKKFLCGLVFLEMAMF